MVITRRTVLKTGIGLLTLPLVNRLDKITNLETLLEHSLLMVEADENSKLENYSNIIENKLPEVKKLIIENAYSKIHSRYRPWFKLLKKDVKKGDLITGLWQGQIDIWPSHKFVITPEMGWTTWYKIGNGEIFNALDISTFKANNDGTLYGTFFDGGFKWELRDDGTYFSYGKPLHPEWYEDNRGDGFESYIIRWNTDDQAVVADALKELSYALNDERFKIGSERLINPIRLPEGWEYYPPVGKGHIYKEISLNNKKAILGKSEKNAHILHHILPEKIIPDESTLFLFDFQVNKLPEGADETLIEKVDNVVSALSFNDWTQLAYPWGVTLSEGDVYRDPWGPDFYRGIVIKDGTKDLGKKIEIKRPVKSDYKKVFGKLPGEINSVGIKVDSDQTKTSAEALWYRISLLHQGEEIHLYPK